MSNQERIDVHHHFVPPKFEEAIQQHGNPEWPAPTWSISASQSIMKTCGILTGILSLTTPGPDVVSTEADQVAIAVDANNTGASVRDSNPSQFGFFATIPNPVAFPEAAMSELRRALDELHADGVTLMSNYSGKYLGNEAFAPLWKELNNRKVIVFIHPISPPEPYKLVNPSLLPPILDFTFETTKAAFDLIMSGTVSQCPDVKIILSHGGGTLPWTWHRVAQLPHMMNMTSLTFEEIREQARSFYFDTALTGWGENIELLISFAKEGHVLYGSDFPYTPNSCIKEMTGGLDGVLDKEGNQMLRESVNFGNALKLFPRFNDGTG